jgi:DNA-binding transcriptional MerR regulator
MPLVTAYKLDDLAQQAEVAPRTIRYYVQRGLLPAPAFRGKDTTYDDEHLVRLRAIRRLQQAHLPLDEIQARLASASRTELERMAAQDVVEVELPAPERVPPVAPYPVRHPYRRPPASPPAAPDRSPNRWPMPLPSRRQAWERIELAPGVELHVRTDADPEALRVAEEIQRRFTHRI